MAVQHWLKHPLIGTSIAVATMLLVAALANHYQHASPKEPDAADFTKSTKEIGAKASLPLTAPKPKQDPDRQEWRSEEDLRAQKQMALWAAVSAMAAIFGLGVTTIGIIFVKRTLDANRDAVRAAVAAVHNDRAWIAFEGTETAQIADPVINGIRYKRGFSVNVRWSNAGRSPALRTANFVEFQLIGTNDDLPAFKVTLPPGNATVGPERGFRTGVRVLNGTEYDAVANRRSRLIVYSRVEYEDVYAFGVTRHSEVCLEILINGQQVVDGSPRPNVEVRTVGVQNTAT